MTVGTRMEIKDTGDGPHPELCQVSPSFIAEHQDSPKCQRPSCSVEKGSWAQGQGMAFPRQARRFAALQALFLLFHNESGVCTPRRKSGAAPL